MALCILTLVSKFILSCLGFNDVELIFIPSFNSIQRDVGVSQCLQTHLYIPLTHWDRGKMAAISQTTLSNAFSWMKMLISIKISLKFVPKGPINSIPALVQIMAWRRPGDKPSFEAMMVSLLTHICVTRPQWVKHLAIPVPFYTFE